jgi:hypothetical protein
VGYRIDVMLGAGKAAAVGESPKPAPPKSTPKEKPLKKRARKLKK